MTDQHYFIAPPIELLKNWEDRHFDKDEHVDVLLIEAYNAGAYMELEACCEWLGNAPVVYNNNGELHPGSYLRDARRPKPLSLERRALSEVAAAVAGGNITPERGAAIRLALEQLND